MGLTNRIYIDKKRNSTFSKTQKYTTKDDASFPNTTFNQLKNKAENSTAIHKTQQSRKFYKTQRNFKHKITKL